MSKSPLPYVHFHMTKHFAYEVFLETFMETVTNFHRCFPQCHHSTMKVNQNTSHHLHFLCQGSILLSKILVYLSGTENKKNHAPS